MSADPPSTYLFKTRAMFNRVRGERDGVVHEWMRRVHRELVVETYGPGNQYDDTEYIAVGRLRMGWTWGLDAPSSVPINRKFPGIDYTQFGDAAVAKLDAEFEALGVHPHMTLYNVVGYGWYVHEGQGTHSHIGPRPWVQLFAEGDTPHYLLNQVLAERGFHG